MPIPTTIEWNQLSHADRVAAWAASGVLTAAAKDPEIPLTVRLQARPDDVGLVRAPLVEWEEPAPETGMLQNPGALAQLWRDAVQHVEPVPPSTAAAIQ
jgi:hypothetical protein